MRRGSRGARTARLDEPAKLTGMVNIAVFAAFWLRDMGGLLSNAAFKPVCRFLPLDVSRYGWQKRQDRGKNGKGRGTISTDSGTIWRITGRLREGDGRR